MAITPLEPPFFGGFMNIKLKHITVNILPGALPGADRFTFSMTATPQEAFQILMMPAFTGLISSLVPEYEVTDNELSEVSEEED